MLFAPALAWAQCTGACATTTVGADTVHTFTGNGTFTPPAGVTSVQYLVVGGGGGGGGITAVNAGGAGGGGAGGLLSGAAFAVTPLTVYNIVVGAGGTPGVGGTGPGGSGGNSTFSTLTAVGGGGGASIGNNDGVAGGSGGGGRLNSTGAGGAGTGGQGNAGGDGASAGFAAGGGGGASAAGATPTSGVGGNGGAGTASTITGASVTYAGGGGGGGYNDVGGAGGAGGGGAAPATRDAGANGTANTGGGGGGASGSTAGAAFDGGAGASGVVIVRYTIPPGRYAVASGNWNATSTWSAGGCGGAPGASVPAAGIDVIICNTRTVTVNAATATIGNLTIQPTGTLIVPAFAITVGGTTTVDGTLSITSATGAKTFTGAVQINAGGTLANTGNAAVAMGNSLTNDGTFTSGTGTYTFQTTAGAVWAGTAGLNFAGAVTVSANRINNTTTSVTGNLTGAATLTNSAAQTLRLGGTSTITGLTATAPNNTVVYNGAAAQTVKTTDYYNLTVNKATGIATTAAGTVNVAGALSVDVGTLNIAGTTVVVTGPTSVTGTLGFTSATGTKTLTGAVTVNAGGAWSNTGNEGVTFRGGLTHDGATFTAGTGVYLFDTASQNIGGSSALSIPNITVTGVTLTNTGTLSVTTALSGTGGLTNAANRTLNLGGASAITTLTATANGNTVRYNGTGAQTVKSTDYFNLTVDKSAGTATSAAGTVNVAGALSVDAGILNLAGTTVAVAGTTSITGTLGITNTTGTKTFNGDVVINTGGLWNHTVNSPVALNGNLSNNGTFTANTGAAAIYTFGGGSAQSITGTAAGSTTFDRLTLNNANGLSLTGTHDVTVTTLLTLTSGRITTGANILFVANGSAITGAGAAAFVVGNLRKAYTTGNQTRVFEVGTVAGGVRYAPVSITLGNVTVAGNVTVSSTAGDHPQIAGSSLNPALSVNRYWTLTNNSANFTAVAGNSVSFNYVAADFDSGAAFASFYVGEYNSPSWTELAPSATSATTTTISGTGITTASIDGDYQVAERGAPLSLVSATLVCGTTNQVEVLFSRPVTAVTAQNIGNYGLDGGATVSGAVLDAGGQLVTLTTSALAAAQLYTLTVNNVAGVSGGTVPANSQASFFTEGGYLSGLLGNYFANMTLTGTPTQRIDGPVDFDWGTGTPGVAGIGANNFSVRWQGFVTPPVTGNYTFRTRSDDGVRLYVNGALVIDNWTDHGPTNNDSAPIALTAGQRYAVVMEYYENGGGAVAQLSWSGPATSGFQFIPRAQLSHFCGLPRPVAFYRMDEASWNGTPGEVIDASGNGLHATAYGGAVPGPAQVCNGALLNPASPAPLDRYVEIAHDARFNATTNLTVSAWIRPVEWPSSGLMTIASKDDNWEFHINTAGQVFWWWNTGGAALTTTGAAAAPLNTWTHVAIVFALGQQTIYVNGVPRATGADGATLFNNTLPLQIGGDQNFAGGGRRFRGMIDELRIYNQTLSQADIATIMADTRPCAVFFNHVRIEHDGLALTCQPETVTVRACADALCASTYAGSVQTTLTPTGWVGGDTITFSGGTTTAQLRTSTAGIITLGAGATTPLPVAAARCFNGASETCSLEFKTSGFIFDVPDLTSCKPSAAVTLTAVRADDTSQTCVPAFESGDRLVKFWSTYSNPATGGNNVVVNGISVGTSAPGDDVNLTFAAGAVSSLTVRYPDAGQMQLHARYTGTGAETGLVMDGTDTFVAVPVGMAVVPSGGACVAGDATCAAYRKAGETFTHDVRAACWTSDADTDLTDNPVTPNFRMAAIPLSSTRIAPVPGTDATLGAGSATLGAGDNGAVTVSQRVDQVGVFTITATPVAGGYFGLTVPAGTSPNIGRFTPDHYFHSGAATLSTRAAAACSPASSFTYLDEGFGVSFTLQARNTAGTVMQNYGTANGFAKLNPATIADLGFGARDGATLLTSRLDLGAGSAGTFAAGSSVITATLGVRRIAAPDGPYAAVQLGIAPTDSDGITITGVDFDGDATPGNERKNLSVTTEVRFGRLRLQNAYGSGTVALPLPTETQYWNGAAFIRNGDDDCTRISAADVLLSDYKLNLGAGETTIVEATIAFAAGLGRLTLSPPGASNNGSVLLTPDLSTAGLGYLKGAWPGPTWDQNPGARAGFGYYGSQPRNFIFFRENY